MLLAAEEMMHPVRGLLAGQSPRAATVGAGPGAWRWYCGVAQRMQWIPIFNLTMQGRD